MRAQSIRATLIPTTLERCFAETGLTASLDLNSHNVPLTGFTPQGTEELNLHEGVNEAMAEMRGEQMPLAADMQELLLDMCRRRIGEAKAALARLINIEVSLRATLSDPDRALLSPTMSRLHDCDSQHRQAEDQARSGRNAASWKRVFFGVHKYALLRIQALHVLCMARKMQLGPFISYGVPAVDFRPPLYKCFRVFIGYVSAALQMRIVLFLLDHRASNLEATTSALNGWHWYLDHLLVLIAFVEGAASKLRVLKPIARLLLRAQLRAVLKQASTTGDARILGHVQKQLQGYGFHSAMDVQLASDAYELTTDPLNQALVHRNAGNAYLTQGKMSEAETEFERMLLLATQCESRTTGLKALVGLYVCGRKITESDLLTHTRGLSAIGYEEFVIQFRRAVAETQSGTCNTRRSANDASGGAIRRGTSTD